MRQQYSYYKRKREKRNYLIGIAVVVAILMIIYEYLNGMIDIYQLAAIIVCVPFLMWGLYLLIRLIKRKSYRWSLAAQIDSNSKRKCTWYIADYLQEHGFASVECLDDTQGKLSAVRYGRRYAVLVVKSSDRLKVQAIQDVLMFMHECNADKAMIITNSYLTSNAQNRASECDVKVWDRRKLKSKRGVNE